MVNITIFQHVTRVKAPWLNRPARRERRESKQKQSLWLCRNFCSIIAFSVWLCKSWHLSLRVWLKSVVHLFEFYSRFAAGAQKSIGYHVSLLYGNMNYERPFLRWTLTVNSPINVIFRREYVIRRIISLKDLMGQFVNQCEAYVT